MVGIRKGKIFRIFSVVVCVFPSLLFPLYHVHCEEHNPNNAITLEKDKDRTVYSIGPGDRGAIREDTERSWEMLRGVVIDTRGSSGGKGSDNNR